MSIRKAALKMGISPSYLSRLLKNQDAVSELCNLLEVDLPAAQKKITEKFFK